MNEIFQILTFYVAMNVFAIKISGSKSNYASVSGWICSMLVKIIDLLYKILGFYGSTVHTVTLL
jgi:hypothetical protein